MLFNHIMSMWSYLWYIRCSFFSKVDKQNLNHLCMCQRSM